MECVGCLPVSTPQAAQRLLGMTVAQCRAAVARGDLVRLRRGVLVGSCHVERAAREASYSHLLQTRAMLQGFEDAVAGYESAAVVRGLPVLTLPKAPRLIRASGAWRGGSDVRVRIARLPAQHVETVDGLRVTSIARTVVDISRVEDLRAAAVVGDAAMRRGCSREVLRETVDECAQWSDVGKARRAVEFFDPLAESAFESVSRATMDMYDVPMPDLQVWVQGATGRWYRVDFLWKARRLIGEADGLAKYLDDPRKAPKQVLRAEKERQEDLGDNGYDFIRWRYGPLMSRPAETMDRILRKLA